MRWGCHSFGGIHAIFSVYSGSSLKTRFEIIKKILTCQGIIGFVYCSRYGESSSIEGEIEKMGNYGIVHGKINCEQHNYYRNEDKPLEDELRSKLKQDIDYFEKRKQDLTSRYAWDMEQMQLALSATKFRLDSEFEEEGMQNGGEHKGV